MKSSGKSLPAPSRPSDNVSSTPAAPDSERGLPGRRSGVKKSDEKTFLPLEQFATLLRDVSCLKSKAFLGIMYAAGLKLSEVRRLEVADIDLQNRKVRLVGGKKRAATIRNMPRCAADLISRYITEERPQRWLFESRHLKAYTSKGMEEWLKRLGRQASLPVTLTPEVVRASFIIHLFQLGIAKDQIMALCGLKSTKALEPYLNSCKINEIRPINPFQLMGTDGTDPCWER